MMYIYLTTWSFEAWIHCETFIRIDIIYGLQYNVFYNVGDLYVDGILNQNHFRAKAKWPSKGRGSPNHKNLPVIKSFTILQLQTK